MGVPSEPLLRLLGKNLAADGSSQIEASAMSASNFTWLASICSGGGVGVSTCSQRNEAAEDEGPPMAQIYQIIHHGKVMKVLRPSSDPAKLLIASKRVAFSEFQADEYLDGRRTGIDERRLKL